MVIIVDGHHFFSRSLYAMLSSMKAGAEPFLTTEKDQVQFIQKVSIDIFSQIRTIKPNSVIWVFDNKSWRKNPGINPIISEKVKDLLFDYKSNREYDESKINWKKYASLIDEFCQILNSKGFLVIRQPGLEGDDLCAIISRRLMSDKKNCMILTADGDIRTLVKQQGDNYTLVFNPVNKDKKIFVPLGFKNWHKEKLTGINLFSVNLSEVNPMTILPETDYVEIDTTKLNFFKIFAGKANEAVPPIWEWKTSTDGNRKISDKNISEIWQTVIQFDPAFTSEKFEDIDVRKKIAELTYIVINKKIKKLEEKDLKNIDIIQKNILVNYYFKYLSSDLLSPSLLEYPMAVNLQSRVIKSHINEMLDGTRFAKTTQMTSDIFDLLNK